MTSKITISALLICLLFGSTAFSQKIEKEGIPPDYNCAGCVLVIFKKEIDTNWHKKEKRMYEILNEKFEDDFIKNYDGSTVFITEKELHSNPLYTDKSKYRFVLNGSVYGVPQSITYDNFPGKPASTTRFEAENRWNKFNYTVSALNLQLYDRLNSKGYPQLSNWPNWKKNMEKVAEALNKVIKN